MEKDALKAAANPMTARCLPVGCQQPTLIIPIQPF
jgi:hypothetical protein